MDNRRFDLLARRLSTRISRRGTLAVFLGGAAATVAGGEARAADPARTTCRAANGICRTNAQCCSGICDTSVVAHRTRRNRCGCPAPLTPCGSQCVDTQTSERNCGACGRRCPAGQICRDGACQMPSCDGSDALVCLETTEGTIVELDHECLEGDVSGCQSSVACRRWLDELIADAGPYEDWYGDLRATCVVGGVIDGQHLDGFGANLCLIYPATRVYDMCPD